MEEVLHKKTKKHILRVKNCVHNEYVNKTRELEKKYIHCRSCEIKWAEYERFYIKYILNKLNINCVHEQTILNYIGFNKIVWNPVNYKIMDNKEKNNYIMRQTICTIPINPYLHCSNSKICRCINCNLTPVI